MNLVTIPDVEVLKTGTYSLSTGEATFTAEDLASAVKAQNDPTIPTPRLKLGHTDERFTGDGEPAIGKVENMRLSDDGQTIVGDLTDVPEWIAEIMHSAFPSRSIEGAFKYPAASGRDYDFVISDLALLGSVWPGVGSLKDIESLFNGQMQEDVQPIAACGGLVVCASLGDEMKIPKFKKKVEASINIDDVRRQYYDSLTADEAWWWIREMRIDPLHLIVEDDDTGEIYRVPFSISGTEVKFDDPVKVEVVYQDVAASAEGKLLVVFASRAESRPDQPKEENMDPKQIRASLGLPEDATDEQVHAALAKASELIKASDDSESTEETEVEETEETEEDDESSEGTEEEEAGGDDDSGTVEVDAAAFQEMSDEVKLARASRLKNEKKERDDTIAACVKDGKFPRSRVKHYAKMWDADPEGTKQLLASLEKGLVPVDEKGSAEAEEIAASSAYDPNWLSPQERAAAAAGPAGDQTTYGQIVRS